MIKGIIFDLDGVLVSTDKLHFKAWKRLAEEIGINGYNMEDNVRQRGVSRMDSLEILLKKSERIYTTEEKEKLADRKNRYYQELLSMSGEDILLPGAIKTLDLLKQKKLKCTADYRQNPNWVVYRRIGVWIGYNVFQTESRGLSQSRREDRDRKFTVSGGGRCGGGH